MNLPVLAGTLSTVLFAVGMLPMLVKAARTKDLASYSPGSLILSNVANAVHSVYVFNLPAGPIWVLHFAYVLASALMLVWWIRYGHAVPTAGQVQGQRQAGRQEGSFHQTTSSRARLAEGGEQS